MPTLEQRIDERLGIQHDLESRIDQRLGIAEQPTVAEAIDPKAEGTKIIDILDISDELELPIQTVSENYDMLIADPKDISLPEPESYERMAFRLPPEPTTIQKIKYWFIGKPEDRRYLPPDADRIEKIDHILRTVSDVPLRTFLKFGKGMQLNVPDLAWAIVKRVTPDRWWVEEVKNMNLDQAMDWAAGYNPSGFAEVTGEVAEFMGRLRTARGISEGITGPPPEGLGVLGKAAETAKIFGIAAIGGEVTKGFAEAIDEAEYGYRGGVGIVTDMAIGAILSIAHSGIGGIWSKLKPTEQAKALKLLGLKEGATAKEITAASRKLAMKYHPDKAKGLESEFKKVMNARDFLRKGAKQDIIYAKGKPPAPKLLEGAVKPSSKAVSSLKPIAEAGKKMHDWTLTFGEAKRTNPKLYDQLMKSYGKRNAGIEKAISQLEKSVGQKMTVEQAANLARIYEDKRLTPPKELKDTYNKFVVILDELQTKTIDEGILARPFQERMSAEIENDIDKLLFKLRSQGKDIEASKKFKELLAEEEAIKNMRYLPHNIVAQRAIEAKVNTLKGDERTAFLNRLSRISAKFKKRTGRSFLKDYIDSGLLEPKDIDIRKLTAEALADYYYRSSIQDIFDYSKAEGFIKPFSKKLRAEGWLKPSEIGITSLELKRQLIHPALGSALAEMKAMRRGTGGVLRQVLGMVKIGQFVKPWIIWNYNIVQKFMRGMYGLNPVAEAGSLGESFRAVLGQTELYHKLNESNLYQFPYEVSKASKDEQIRMMLRRMDANPKIWHKAIKYFESLTNTSWAKEDVTIRKALTVFYQAIARATWTGDKVQRTQSYLVLRRMGYGHDEAVKVASRSHGAYSLLSEKYKKFWSNKLFVYSFRLLMPAEITKIALEPIVGVFKAAVKGEKIPAHKAKRWAKALIASIGLPYLLDYYMKSRGFEKEGAHLGPLAWKWKKVIADPETGRDVEVVVGVNDIINMPIKYWQRLTYYNPIRPEARWQQSIEHVLKWEVHPVWRIWFWDIAENRKSFGTGLQVYDPEDNSLAQAGQIAKYVFGQSLRFWGGMMDAVGEGSMTEKERAEQEKIFDVALTKFDKVLFSVLGYKYTRHSLEERRGIMAKYLQKEIKSRQFNIARKYEGAEKDKRIADLEKWARKCQHWIENEMK